MDSSPNMENVDSPQSTNNARLEQVTVPSHRYHPTTSSSISSTTAMSTSSASSFSTFPPPPMLTYPMSYSSYPTQQESYHHEFNLPPPPPPPPLSFNNNNQHIIRSHDHKWSPPEASSSSHPYAYRSTKEEVKERRHRKQPHELLSESQKKANHIASEQKRRQNIRIGFDQLIDIVPSLNHGNRSEALILQKSVDHIRHLISIKNELKNQVRELQGTLGDTNYEEDSSEDELMYSF